MDKIEEHGQKLDKMDKYDQHGQKLDKMDKDWFVGKIGKIGQVGENWTLSRMDKNLTKKQNEWYTPKENGCQREKKWFLKLIWKRDRISVVVADVQHDGMLGCQKISRLLYKVRHLFVHE